MHKDYSEKIQVELVRLLYHQVRFLLWAESIAAIALFFALHGVIRTNILFIWLLSNLLICGFGRHILVMSYQSNSNTSQESSTGIWLTLFTLGSFLSGISWGATGSLLMIPGDMIREMFSILLLLGVISAANPFYSPVPRAYFFFLIPAFVPFAIWLFLQGGIYIILSGLAFIYIVIMQAASFYLSNFIRSSLYLRFENADLVDNLSYAMNELEKRSTHELEKSLSLVRATLEATTDGIVVVNANNELVDFNKRFTSMWNVPAEFLENKNIDEMINLVSEQLSDPFLFTRKFHTLWDSPEIESFDELFFKNGKVFERYSHPQRVGEKCVGIVWSFRDVTGRKLLEAKLVQQANFDSLTGLPNRALVLDRISQAIVAAKYSTLAIMFLDVDRFKLINDTLGHSLGDKLLKTVAERLMECVRENDTVSREGGDEFLIILNNLKNEDEIIEIAHRCLMSIREPFILEGNRFNSSISIGISCYPRDGREAETLIRNADIAMYHSKELGRDNFQFYTEELNKKVQIRLMMENLLREALNKNEFFLVYQPILNLKTGKITGSEALLRWSHPQLGFVAPLEFIPIAEENGMIIPIGEWVIDKACQQLKEWHDKGIPIQMSINLSARQFKRANFLDNLQNILRNTGLPPKSLALELTESIIMDNVENNIDMLLKIREMGIVIMIDDFGTGYSSLNYLKQLPVDKLKIDKSFIQDIPMHADDVAITSAIIALAGRLNLKVVAEGVENKDQLNFLIENHCDEIQGYFFSHAVEAAAFEQLYFAQKEKTLNDLISKGE